MKYNTDYSKLTNGVRVLTIPMPGVESVTALVLVKTGSRNERDEQLGISHVLEHMMLKASKKYPDQLELASAIDSMGAEHNAFTGKEYTGYYITAAARHLPKSLEILGDVMTNPLLPANNLRTEREVIVEEINMYEDLPMERSSEEFENLMFGGSKMGRLIIGSKQTVRGVEAEHLRKYMGEWYRGGNIMVVLAGKVGTTNQQTNGRTKKLLEEYFGEMPSGEMLAYAEPGGYGIEKELFVKRPTEQAHFVLGVPGLTMDDPRRYALQLAQVVLGGPMSSRLFNEIREKRGLAYYVRSVMDTNQDVGYFGVRAGVKLSALSEAIKVVREEMLKLGETVTEKELKLGKEYLLGRLPLQLEGTMEVAQFIGMRALITDTIRQPEEVIQKINEVRLKDVQEVLGEAVKESEIRTCVVGPSFC